MHHNRFVRLRHGGPVLLVLSILCLAFPASAQILNFTAQIDESQANTCTGTGSPATGTGLFTLDTNTGSLDYEITFDVASLLGSETAAHVHGPAPECINAGVVYGLPAGSPKVGNVVLTAQQMQDMIDGLHYVNIHSTAWSGGEIRGQILLDSQNVPSLAEWAFILLAVSLVVIGTVVVSRRRSMAI